MEWEYLFPRTILSVSNQHSRRRKNSGNVSESNNALGKGMVRRLRQEEHGPERGWNPFGYDKSTRSFTICKMPNNPRNQLWTQLVLAN